MALLLHHHHLLLLFLLPFLCLFTFSSQSSSSNHSTFFTLMKQSFSGSSISGWDLEPSVPYCNYPGVGCDSSGDIRVLDLSAWHLTGSLPSAICTYLPKLQVLSLSGNYLNGGFPRGITNCTSLEELDLSWSNITGTVPDLSPLSALRVLDLSYNLLSGKFPTSFTNLTNLEMINFNENEGFDLWKLPEEVARLTKMKRMILTTCSLYGPIPATVGNLTTLVDFELSGNYLTGPIPPEMGQLRNLAQLELYYNQLSGSLPEELGNLSQLTDTDMSVNRLTGSIPESLCRLPKLRVLQLYNNSLTGEIPQVLGNSTTLTGLSLYENLLTGPLPQNLGKFSQLQTLDVSENQLSGELPADICRGERLVYFLTLENQFSGRLPENYARCVSLVRFRVSANQLSGPIPEGLMALPHASIIDLSKNKFDGPMPKSIGSAKNLSSLFVQSNRISGSVPLEISNASNLMKIDLSFNLFSGPIPSEIGKLRKVNLLLLQGNKLNSSIPGSLASLKSLNVLNLSNNLLSGRIPEALCQLLPNSIDFSNNHLSGPVPLPLLKEGLTDSFAGNPELCLPLHANSTAPSLPLCAQGEIQKKVNHIWVIGLCGGVVAVGLLLFLKKWFNREKVIIGKEGLSSWPSFSYDIRSFHKISFDQREIVDALNDKNLVGHGGSGTVYKIELSNGELVAVKKLWTKRSKDSPSDQFIPDRELEAEVETLGNIRHKNIVKLYCCFSSSDSNLLVYEYMPNGNLWDALHRGKCSLDWPTRHRIALGVAQGLAYLHHDLLPSIVHRDIKSTNILLNADYQPKVADFGVAKVLQARGGKDSSSTVIAGTYGYLAPEYAYTAKATTKCDVYSFGVVLSELITGKKPIESEFGENKNIIFWILQKVATKEGAIDVFDKRLAGSCKDEMIQALRIAIRCTSTSPAARPTMSEVVQLLIEADPCRFDPCKLGKKTKDSSPTTISSML